ncbi:MAG: response regulator transcription factor [Opitutae bacterium]|nr:response regulator transcription factor [Opitutae bacterium]
MTPAKPITVLLADDHAIVRQGLCALLDAAGQFEIVGEARNGREAVKLAHALQPDVILMDIAMPVLNGLDATQQILAARPAAKVIILSAHSDDAYVERMQAAGAAGFIEKQTSAEHLPKAIRTVMQGGVFFSPILAKRRREERNRLRYRTRLLPARRVRLTASESEVLQLVAEGSTNKQIAAALGLSGKMIETLRATLMDKLDIHDTAGWVRQALAAGVSSSGFQLTIV